MNQESGIELDAASTVSIEECHITGNHGSGISIRDHSDNIMIMDTNISYNEYGLSVIGACTNITAVIYIITYGENMLEHIL